MIPGAAPIEERFWDGKWTRETRATTYDANGCRTEISVTESSDYPAVTNSVTTYDFLGRVAGVLNPAFGGGWLSTSNFYDGTSSRLLRVTRTGQPGTLYQYDALGNPTATALDVDGDGQIDYAGDDRISATATRHESINGDWWRVTAQSVWHEAGVDVCLTTGVNRVRLTGFGYLGWGWIYSYFGNLTAQSETLDVLGNVTCSSVYTDAATQTSLQVLETPDSIHPTLTYSIAGKPYMTVTAAAVTNYYAYDGFARQPALTDGRGNTTVTHYNALGQADWTENAAGNRTTYGYDALGRQTSETDALNNTVHTAYDSLGNVVSVWGATYPVEYGYDSQGRKVSMKTFREEEGAGDETRWLYDHVTGLLTNKVYADGKGPSYSYTPDGNLATRIWARGVETAYNYDAFGSPIGVDYSDSTPDVTYAYDRLGRVVSATSSVSTNLFEYDGVNLAIETQNGATINRTTDNFGRQSGFSLGTDYVVQYGYDQFGRFTAITSSVLSVSSMTAYSRLDGSDLLASMTNSSGFFWSRTFEQQRKLIASVENRFGENLISAFDYANDSLARRTRRVDNNAVTNDFGYNPRSEVSSALMGTNIYRYAYDPIGNRQTATNNAEGWTYLTNPMNQYTNIADGVIVEPQYDADGNMTATGDGWRYVWNGENRMILASNATTVVTYAYDHQGRMVFKVVNGSPRQYLWDGYNIVADARTACTNWFVWGLDLSGSLQGAGGVGGLLVEVQNGEPYFAAYDANGNVTEYISTNGVTETHYEYSPFGEIVVQSGELADAFTHRFSTKPWCGVTGLSEYLYRKYSPGMGRWLSDDPSGEHDEHDEINLLLFIGNQTIQLYDLLGLWPGRVTCTPSGPSTSTKWFLRTMLPDNSGGEGEGLGVYDAVSCIYTRTEEIPYDCQCKCPDNTTPAMREITYYEERGHIIGYIFWQVGSPGPWPPNDLPGAIGDIILQKLFPPIPLSDIPKERCMGSIPDASIVGTSVIDSGEPTRFCLWK